VRIIGYRNPRTLAAAVSVSGVGFITGARVTARFLPAQPDSGIRFRRTDLPGTPDTPAHASAVASTQRRTTLGPPETGVTLVEHVLAALAGLRLDNLVVELDGPEPPGLDGSAHGFVQSLQNAGAVMQGARRPIYAVTDTLLVRAPGATLALHPTNNSELHATYRLDYGLGAAIPPQTHTVAIRPAEFARELARCRTFLTQAEAEALRAQGIGRHLGPADLLVFGPRGPIANRVRFADEPARHKILDLIGDLALCGFDLAGHLVAYRSGHALNVELARQLVAAGHKPESRKVVKSAVQAA
jgi:UDP-3-O-[3-hydroxymyristoyl] N-acetylglucosamine deacetylase